MLLNLNGGKKTLTHPVLEPLTASSTSGRPDLSLTHPVYEPLTASATSGRPDLSSSWNRKCRCGLN